MGKRKLAIYDLDGTITKRDTLYLFIFFMLKNKKISLKKILLPLIIHIFIKKNADKLKDAVLSALIEKRQNELSDLCSKFVNSLSKKFFREELLYSIRKQKENNYLLILLTSAFDIYAQPLGKKLGFDKIISTKVVFKNGTLAGGVDGNYIKGENKKVMLTRKVDLDNFDLSSSIGYGNKDDLPWLNLLGHKKIY